MKHKEKRSSSGLIENGCDLIPFVLAIGEILPFQILAAPLADSHKYGSAFASEVSYEIRSPALQVQVQRSLDRCHIGNG